MTDYLVEVKIKNAPLMRMMTKAGYKNPKALADACGVAYSKVLNYVLLKEAPMGYKDWKESILVIAAYLKCNPEDLFPEQHYHRPLPKNVAVTEMAFDECAKFAIEKALKRLTVREQEIIERVYLGGEPRINIAKDFDVTVERIRQIESKGIRRLRHPQSPIHDFKDSVRGGK